MKLNDAVLLSKTIDGVECSTMREFIPRLKRSRSLSMDVYVNTKLVCSGPATVRTDSHWIIASTTAQLSFVNSVPVQSIVARIRQGETVLFESVTPCDTIIPSDDTLASFNVCLGNDSPYNDLAKRVPDSKFIPRIIDRIHDVDFETMEAQTINPVSDVTVEEPTLNYPSGDHYTVSPESAASNNDGTTTFVFSVTPEEGYEVTAVEFNIDNGDNAVIDATDGKYSLLVNDEDIDKVNILVTVELA